MEKIKVGIYGYGNLGKSLELFLKNNDKFELIAIFTNRNLSETKTIYNENKLYSKNDITKFKDKIDILILSCGSAKQIPNEAPILAKLFSTIDCYDNHNNLFNYYNTMNCINMQNNTISLIACGWDPGIISLQRLLFNQLLPIGKNYTFYGKGLSQGHTNALKNIDGVTDAIQFTIPIRKSFNKIKSLNDNINNKPENLIKRKCYILKNKCSNKTYIKKQILNLPDYFAPYKTYVRFVNKNKLNKLKLNLSHSGNLYRIGYLNNYKYCLSTSLKLYSNPNFTANILLLYTNALYKIKKEKRNGTLTIFDIPISYLSDDSSKDLLTKFL